MRFWATAAAAMALAACGGGGAPPLTPPPAGEILFTNSRGTVGENAGSLAIDVARRYGSAGAVTVHYETIDIGSAHAGSEYSPVSGDLSWPDGTAGMKQITLPIIDNREGAGDREVKLTLSAPTGGATLGTIADFYLTIQDDEPPAGMISFSNSQFSTGEKAGTATITVNRTQGSYGDVSVRYSAGPARAADGEGIVSWANGDATAKTFEVPVTDNVFCDGFHAASLHLSEVTGGAALTSPSDATLWITDDEPPAGQIKVQATADSFYESAGNALFAVSRVSGNGCPATVDFTTEDSSAYAGNDYSATTGTLHWDSGDDSEKYIAVPIVDNSVFGDRARSFIVRLSNPVDATLFYGGFSWGNITDDDSAGVRFIEGFRSLPAFDSPLFLTAAPGNRTDLYVVEQGGVIKYFANDPTATSTGTFLDLSDRVATGIELGLLGLAFDPNFETNHYLYVNYTAGAPLRTVVSRFTAISAHSVDLTSEDILMTFSQPYQNHKGGWLGFGKDGKLYIASGDGGGEGDPDNNAQRLDTPLGKILRINPDGSTPPDNPFTGTVGAEGAIWAYGFRNPWRPSFDRLTGDFWVGDVGQDWLEEIDLIRKGRNFGWKLCEGSDCQSVPQDYDPPIFEYSHHAGDESITGGYVYRGSAIPSAAGVYFFADFISGQVFFLNYRDGQVAAWNGLGLTSYPSSFGEDLDGELYLLTYYHGRVLRLVKQ